MSSALTEITFWLCGSGYSPAHRGKPSTTFVIAAQPPWGAMCSITIADIAPSLTTRVLWGAIPYGELNAVTGAKATTRSPDHAAAAVNIRRLERSYFRHSGTGGVHGSQNRPVREILQRRQPALHFRGTQNYGELLLVPGQGDAIDADGTVQRVGV